MNGPESSSQDILKNPFFEFKGSGRIVFDDNLSEDVNFIIRMLQTGKVMGDLDFINYHPLAQSIYR